MFHDLMQSTTGSIRHEWQSSAVEAGRDWEQVSLNMHNAVQIPWLGLQDLDSFTIVPTQLSAESLGHTARQL